MTNKFNDPNFDIQPQAAETISAPHPRAEVTKFAPQPRAEVTKFAPHPRAEVTISSPQPRAKVTISSPHPRAEVTKFAPQPRAALTTQELQALVAAAQADEQEAMDKLCEQFRPLVEATAKSYSLYQLLGEDSISIVWLIFIKFIHSFDEPIGPTFPGILQKHLRWRLLNQVRARGNFDPDLVFDDYESVKDKHYQSFDQELANDSEVFKAVRMLKPIDQEIVQLYYIEQLTFPQIALRLHKDENTIRVRHFRILKKLKELLEHS